MILALRTDKPEAYLAILDSDGSVIRAEHWQADRQLAIGLLGKIESLLTDQNAGWEDLNGLVVYQGPGSFTGLRIGITVMNTIAYAQGVPIVGETNEAWQNTGAARLAAGENDKIVLPEYGADARITKPRK